MTHVGQRLRNLGVVLSFLVCYLEWGGGSSAFVAEIEYQVLLGKPEAQSFAHPMIALPFVGQLLVLFTLFQKTPSRRLASIGILLMGVLVLLLALIGVLAANARTGLSTLPFLALAAAHFTGSMRKS
jgi:hypothetical protein